MRNHYYLKVLLVLCYLNPAFAEPLFLEGDFLYPPTVSKKIMGKANFEEIRNLPFSDSDRSIAKKIAHLEMGQYVCTGFLVGRDILLTNHHCVVDQKKKRMISTSDMNVYMRYLQPRDADPTKGGAHAKVLKIIKMNPSLDYALLRLSKPLGDQFGWLELEDRQKNYNGAVKIIQHPHGRSKEIARKESYIIRQYQHALHYLADTQGGSSGSPVMSADANRVIALHHVGVTGKYNEGILMNKIVPEIQQWLKRPVVDTTHQVTDCDPWKDQNCQPTFSAQPSGTSQPDNSQLNQTEINQLRDALISQ